MSDVDQPTTLAPDRSDRPLPGTPWLLAGLTTVHVFSAAALLAGPLSHGVAVVAGAHTVVALLLGGLCVASARYPLHDDVSAGALVASALVVGVGAAVGSPALAVGSVAVVLGVILLRSPHRVAVVLATVAGSVVAGVGLSLLDGGDASGAVIAVGSVLGVAVVVVGLRRVAAQQARVVDAARRSADAVRMTDGLTGVLNRRGLELMAAPMLENARRRGEAVHALFADVDGFADVNRRAGFDRGDDLLAAVGEALRGAARATDVVCRVGGDEFVILGPGTGTSPLELERRLREILRAAPPVDETVWPTALSIGSATLVPWDDGDLTSLLARAEQDMRLRRSLRRQSQDRRDVGTSPPKDARPRSS